MVSQQRIVLKWIFYGALALLALLLQTSVVAEVRLLGVQFCILPVAAACVAAREGKDNGALYGLCCGVFWTLSSGNYGPIYILSLTAGGALCGVACDLWLRRGLLSSLLLSFCMLLAAEGSVCAFLIATGAIPVVSISQVLLPSCVVSLLFVPLFHVCTAGVAKIGGKYGA